jgi:hypothetical protein
MAEKISGKHKDGISVGRSNRPRHP